METEARAVLPVLLGHAQKVEADPERAKEAMFKEDETSSNRSLGKEKVAEYPRSSFRRRFVLFLPFGLVLIVSPMVFCAAHPKRLVLNVPQHGL